ncbi:hypothetical protein ZIOFF_024120 [Zingiber officinale]|uniref:FRIGIDA-like protein n=1 Tax=Zingiber officinale TaxID=94328 RepID=A0A8J5LIW0_ZINOF|nr:hypothetical protein ZIOFF_024120 [Zingiber officinale]
MSPFTSFLCLLIRVSSYLLPHGDVVVEISEHELIIIVEEFGCLLTRVYLKHERLDYEGVLLLDSSLFFADDIQDSLSDKQILTPDIKEKAKVIAKEWKLKLDHLDIEASSGNSLEEAHAFLQLLPTFDIISEFEQDKICKLMPAVTRRRQTVNLCRSLGLSHKMLGLIELLQNSGRQIEVVNLAYAFELTEQFAPVPLLKEYLKEARRISQVKAGSMSPGAQDDISFEKQSALFALAVSDIVLINMWCHDIGREQVANKPLLKTIFQMPLDLTMLAIRGDFEDRRNLLLVSLKCHPVKINMLIIGVMLRITNNAKSSKYHKAPSSLLEEEEFEFLNKENLDI